MHVHHASCLRVELHLLNLQQLSHTLLLNACIVAVGFVNSLTCHEYLKFLKMHQKDHLHVRVQLHKGPHFSASIDLACSGSPPINVLPSSSFMLS